MDKSMRQFDLPPDLCQHLREYLSSVYLAQEYQAQLKHLF